MSFSGYETTGYETTGYETKSVEIRPDIVLDVRVKIPANPSSTIVIHHGYGGSFDSGVVKRLSDIFADRGYAVVVPNTKNSLNSSGGDIGKFTFTGHALDLQGVVDWTQNQDWFAKGALDLAGYSLGGFSAIKATGVADVRALYLVAPILSGEFFWQGLDASAKGMMSAWKKEGELGFTNDQGKKFNAPYACWYEWTAAFAESEQSKFKGRVRILKAEEDPLIQPTHLRQLEKGFVRASSIDVITVKGETHFFDKVPRAIETWLLTP